MSSSSSGEGARGTSASQTSRPSTSQSCSRPSPRAPQGGVLTTTTLTNQRLGFFSPSYGDKDHTTSHGIMGGIGYTSSMHRTLVPALQKSLREPGAGRQGRASSCHRSARQQLSQQDLQYLRDNEERNKRVFEAWRQVKDEEIASKSAQEERQRVDDLRRFKDKEVQLKEEVEVAVSEWVGRKSAQASLEAMQRALLKQQGRQQVIGTKIRSAAARTVDRGREQRFLLQTGPHALPTRVGFYATLGGSQELASC